MASRPNQGNPVGEDRGPPRDNGDLQQPGEAIPVGDDKPRKHSCVVTYNGDAATESAIPDGFVIVGRAASGKVAPVPNPKSGPSISVQQTWENFRIDAERNLILDLITAIEAVTAAVGKAATLADLKSAVADVLKAVEPLLFGKKMLYSDTWSFSFSCAATIDGEEDLEHEFEVDHSIGFSAGITSPAGEDNIHWAIKSDVTVDVAEPSLGYASDEKKPEPDGGKPFTTHAGRAARPVRIGPGAHTASEVVLLTIDVDDYGEECKKLIEQLKTILKDIGTVLDSLSGAVQGTNPAKALLDSIIKAVKDYIKAQLEDVKLALKKSTGRVEIGTSNFRIRCVGRQVG
jgi:hypothetical protein